MKYLVYILFIYSCAFASDDYYYLEYAKDVEKIHCVVPEPSTYIQASVMVGFGAYILYKKKKKCS